MAKQVGEFKFTGRIGDVSFYKCLEEYYAREAGGPSKEKIKKLAVFARVREHNEEFGACANAGKLLRTCLNTRLKVSDAYAYRRVTKLMNEIKNMDVVSAPGKRRVGNALEGEAAKNLLKSFNFNKNSPMEQVMLRRPLVGLSREIYMDGFLPGKDLVFPEGADEAELKGAKMNIDFEAGRAEISPYKDVIIKREGGLMNLVLEPLKENTMQGHELYFLQVVFYSSKTGQREKLNGGIMDAMSVVAVNPRLLERKERKLKHVLRTEIDLRERELLPKYGMSLKASKGKRNYFLILDIARIVRILKFGAEAPTSGGGKQWRANKFAIYTKMPSSIRL